MNIRLKSLVWKSKLLIFSALSVSLMAAFGFRGVSAQAPLLPNITEIVVAAQAVNGTDDNGKGAPSAKGCLTTTPYYQAPISQANFLKYEKTVCSLKSSGENEMMVARKISVVLSAYSSTIAETDDSPFITANGSYVHDGVIANNMLPFGTKVKIPALYGDKIFLVEDRMHWRKSDYNFDIWFPTHQQAEQFGIKYAFLEILK